MNRQYRLVAGRTKKDVIAVTQTGKPKAGALQSARSSLR
jgi:hypothetical protein